MGASEYGDPTPKLWSLVAWMAAVDSVTLGSDQRLSGPGESLPPHNQIVYRTPVTRSRASWCPDDESEGAMGIALA